MRGRAFHSSSSAAAVGAVAPVVALGQLLRLGDQTLLLSSSSPRPSPRARPGGLPLLGDHGEQGVEPADQAGQVTDRAGVDDLCPQVAEGLGGLVGRHDTGEHPLLEQVHAAASSSYRLV
jgi:hypothetical protein